MQGAIQVLCFTFTFYMIIQRLCIFGLYGAIQMLLLLLLLLLFDCYTSLCLYLMQNYASFRRWFWRYLEVWTWFFICFFLGGGVLLKKSGLIFSEHTTCRRPFVCRLSVTFVHHTQSIQIFGNVSTPFGTLAIHWHPGKILRRSSQGNHSVRGLKHRGVAEYSDFGPIERYISKTVQDRS